MLRLSAKLAIGTILGTLRIVTWLSCLTIMLEIVRMCSVGGNAGGKCRLASLGSILCPGEWKGWIGTGIMGYWRGGVSGIVVRAICRFNLVFWRWNLILC